MYKGKGPTDRCCRPFLYMTAIARLYIGTVIVVGTCVLVAGGLHWQTQLPFKFVSYLIVAVLASRLKVNLPGITGTMSVNFLFILLGVLELSFGETLVLGAAAILTQCFYRDRPNIVQVLFNICATSFAIAASFGVYHMFYDLAMRDLEIAAAAFVLSQLTAVREEAEVREHRAQRTLGSQPAVSR